MNLNDVKTIVNNLEDFIEVRDGIERLRMIIRTLAVSGKLIPQNFTDGTGEDLVNQIEATRLMIGSRKRKDREGTQVTDAETFFKIPKSWKWVRFGFVFDDYGSGSTPSRGSDVFYKNGKINWYKSGELKDGILSEDSEERIAQEALEKCHLRLNKPGDLLLAMYGATAGRLAILKNHGTTNQAVWGGTPNKFVSLDYLFLYMLQSRSELLKMSSGAAQPNISGEKIISHVFPLPPYAEQERIVARVEEIMIQLDALQMKKRERDDVRGRLTKNAMHSLGLGDTDIALKNLEELVKTPNDLKELEKSILTLAFSGKLVSQLATDGNAADLFDEIKQKQYIGQVKKKRTALSPITDEECPFDIPKTWKWIRLGECISISSGDLLRVSDANHGEYLVYGGNGIAGRHTAFNAKKGTIVIGRVGALCGVAHITETDAWVTDNAFIVNYPEEFLDKNFFKLLLNHLNLRQAHRGSAQPVISGISVYPMLMPLPPLQEQKRIAEKVEKVMELIKPLRLLLSKD